MPPSEQDAEDRQLTGWRKRLGQSRTRTINKIKHLLRKHNLEQECPTKGIDTIKGKTWLSQVSAGPIDRLEMDQLLAAVEAVGRADRARWRRRLPSGRQQAAGPRRSWRRSRAAGPTAAWPWPARIGAVQRFPRPGSLANYWGLTPGCRNSGEATDRLGSITKQGSAMARFILAGGRARLAAGCLDEGWYGRIKRRRGRRSRRVAVMRRLAAII